MYTSLCATQKRLYSFDHSVISQMPGVSNNIIKIFSENPCLCECPVTQTERKVKERSRIGRGGRASAAELAIKTHTAQ